MSADQAFLELSSNVLLTEARSCQDHLSIFVRTGYTNAVLSP